MCGTALDAIVAGLVGAFPVARARLAAAVVEPREADEGAMRAGAVRARQELGRIISGAGTWLGATWTRTLFISGWSLWVL